MILVLSIVVPFTVSYAQNNDGTWLDPETEDVPTSNDTSAQDFDDGSQYEQNDDYIPEEDVPSNNVNVNQQQKTVTPTTGTTVNKTTTGGTGSNVSAKLQNPLKVNSIEAVILLAVDIMIYVGVSFAILALIFVGLKFVMAQGKPEEINKAKAWFLWIIIGLAVLISAKVIVEIVQNTLVKSGVVNQGFLKP